MGVAAGPNNVNEGLVFGFDTGYVEGNYIVLSNNARFSKGRGGASVENRAAYYNAVAQPSYTPYVQTTSGTWQQKHPNAIRAYNAAGNEITGYVNTGVTDYANTYHAHWQYDDILKKPVVVMEAFDSNWKAKSFSIDTAAWSTHGVSTGDKYVISWDQWTNNINKAVHVGVYCKNSSGSNNFWDGLSGGSATSKNTEPGTWQRVYHVYTVSSNHDLTRDYETIYMYGHSLGPNGAPTTIKISDVQIELITDYPSAYVPLLQNRSGNHGVRLTTENLLDLSKNASINTNNTSYNSDGITFDGTDDYILTSLTGVDLDGGCTIEGVLRRESTPGAWRTFFNIKPSGANTPFFEFRSTGAVTNIALDYFDSSDYITSAETLTNNQYYHCVGTYDGNGNLKMYINGDLKQTKTSVPAFNLGSSPRLTVGRAYSNDRYTDITVPVVRIYNTPLTPEQIKENYLTYKQRFDI